MLGMWLNQYGGHVQDQLRIYQPGIVLIGDGAFNHIQEIYNDCRTQPVIILRWVAAGFQNVPELVADFLCNWAKRFPHIRFIIHGLNEDYKGHEKEAALWELRFVNRCHKLGYQTICNNWAFGNYKGDEIAVFREVHNESDFNGPHLYAGWSINLQDIEVSDGKRGLASCYRYLQWPDWWDLHRHIPTECGIDHWAAGGSYVGPDKPGYQNLGIGEEWLLQELTKIVTIWKIDGIPASIYYCMAHQNPIWRSYYLSDTLLHLFTKVLPRIGKLGGLSVPVPTQLYQAIELLNNSNEQTLQFKAKINAAKTDNNTWFQMAEDLEKGDSQAGTVYNQNVKVLALLEEVKKALNNPPV